MSNLGPYQDFTTAAKKAGGVVKLLGIIEKNAVDAAKPALLAKGGLGGVVVTVVAMVGGKRYLDKREADKAKAEEAKRLLVEEFGDENEIEPGSDD